MRRLLVANRGEIALRVFRACGSLGIETVAVVAPDDAGSLHARSADTTVVIASYLDAAEIVRAALETDADSVHPGYGFLAESAGFAEAVLAAGLTWSDRRLPRFGPAATSSPRRRLRARRVSRCCRAGRRTRSASRCWSRRPPVEADAACASSARRTSSAKRSLPHGARPGRVRGRHGLLRALSRAAAPCGDPAARRRARHRRRAGRARVLGAAPPPEGARGVAVDGARSGVARRDERRGDRVRARDRLRERRHGRVHAVRPRVLVPRAERAHPGRASGDGARVRRRPRP